jgi:hypothetical protein
VITLGFGVVGLRCSRSHSIGGPISAVLGHEHNGLLPTGVFKFDDSMTRLICTLCSVEVPFLYGFVIMGGGLLEQRRTRVRVAECPAISFRSHILQLDGLFCLLKKDYKRVWLVLVLALAPVLLARARALALAPLTGTAPAGRRGAGCAGRRAPPAGAPDAPPIGRSSTHDAPQARREGGSSIQAAPRPPEGAVGALLPGVRVPGERVVHVPVLACRVSAAQPVGLGARRWRSRTGWLPVTWGRTCRATPPGSKSKRQQGARQSP